MTNISIKELAEQLLKENENKYEAINWNEDPDGYSQIFWNQFKKQLWFDTEINVGKDKKQWILMTPAEKQVFKHNFAALTLFDTYQSELGMPNIKEMVDNKIQKAVLGFMEMMESVHAKSYSTIFTTLMNKFEIDELFIWSKENKYLQYKMGLIAYYYERARSGSKLDLYLGMVNSVYLESFLFYSGFYYPLRLAGEGRMTASADMINLIIRDEALHGVYVGMIAQNLYDELTPSEQKYADEATYEILDVLMENEITYTHEIYGVLGGEITQEVIEFVKYNANKALMNLGRDAIYEGVSINPVVENGLNTETKMHDMFSLKGNGYIKSNIEETKDEDWVW